MTEKLFVVEKLTDDKRDYTIAHLVTNLDVAVALCSRDESMSISEWTYNKSLYRFDFTQQYNCKGEPVEDE